MVDDALLDYLKHVEDERNDLFAYVRELRDENEIYRLALSRIERDCYDCPAYYVAFLALRAGE